MQALNIDLKICSYELCALFHSAERQNQIEMELGYPKTCSPKLATIPKSTPTRCVALANIEFDLMNGNWQKALREQ